jgi:hypothetical protein
LSCKVESDLNHAIDSAFVALAGGPASHIVVIPTASVGDAGPPGMAATLARRMKESFGVAADTYGPADDPRAVAIHAWRMHRGSGGGAA